MCICNDINWHPEISISDQSEMGFSGMPIYEGCPYLVHQKLVPGDYLVTMTNMSEMDESFSDDMPAIVRVTESESDWVCVNCGMTADECTSDNSGCGYAITDRVVIADDM